MTIYKKILNWLKGRIEYEEFEYDPEYIDKMTAIFMQNDKNSLVGSVKNDLTEIRLARLEKLQRKTKI